MSVGPTTPQVLGSAAIVLGTVAVVASISNLMQGPTAEQPPNAAEWLSAISTFWGAVATAVGAILTAGALLIAALSYRHQTQDKHRALEEQRKAQASAVVLILHKGTILEGRSAAVVTNGSPLPVYKVELYCRDPEGRPLEDGRPYVRDVFMGEFPAYFDEGIPLYDAYVDFTDQATNRWRRWSDGRLEELPKEAAEPETVS